VIDLFDAIESTHNFKTVQYWTEVDPVRAYAQIDLDRETLMRRNNSQLRLMTDTPVASTKLTDTSGNPSESYHWRQMAAVRREWQHEFRTHDINPFELSVAEIRSIEMRVRRELYP